MTGDVNEGYCASDEALTGGIRPYAPRQLTQIRHETVKVACPQRHVAA